MQIWTLLISPAKHPVSNSCLVPSWHPHANVIYNSYKPPTHHYQHAPTHTPTRARPSLPTNSDPNPVPTEDAISGLHDTAAFLSVTCISPIPSWANISTTHYLYVDVILNFYFLLLLLSFKSNDLKFCLNPTNVLFASTLILELKAFLIS